MNVPSAPRSLRARVHQPAELRSSAAVGVGAVVAAVGVGAVVAAVVGGAV